MAENHALLEGVRCHYSSIVGHFSSLKGREVTKKCKQNIWEDITKNVNAIGAGEKRTTKQVILRWKNLKAKTTKDLAEAKNPTTGNKPFKWGEYTDIVLDIIGGDISEALYGIDGVEVDGEPTVAEECGPGPPNEQEIFVLNLSQVVEEEEFLHCKYASSSMEVEELFNKLITAQSFLQVCDMYLLYDLPLVIMPPAGVFYPALLSMDAINLNQLCHIMYRYRENLVAAKNPELQSKVGKYWDYYLKYLYSQNLRGLKEFIESSVSRKSESSSD
ncbi:CENPI protein, partial [Polypterus senegalus]